MKLKIRATGRKNKRYLLLKANSKNEVEEAILDYIGILGWSKAAPLFVKSIGNKIIIAINREEINNVRAAFELYSEKIEILNVSGTLKGLNRNL